MGRQEVLAREVLAAGDGQDWARSRSRLLKLDMHDATDSVRVSQSWRSRLAPCAGKEYRQDLNRVGAQDET